MPIIKNLIALTKPRILLLLAITCLGGALVATKGNTDLLNWQLIAFAVIGLTLSAGGANAINMWFDHDIDQVMTRTKKRPLPTGAIKPVVALLFGLILGLGSFLFLGLTVNWLTAWLAAAGYAFYVLIYTFCLKRNTVHNIVIGGAAGAFPPLVGWAAVRGDVSELLPWAMFAIIFLWTPPHFWALAIDKNADYTKAGIPMLPVIKGEAETKVQIVYYMLLLIPVTLAVAMVPPLGWIYFAAATVLGAMWLTKAVRLMYGKKGATPYNVFKFSLSYLALLFAAMVIDTFL